MLLLGLTCNQLVNLSYIKELRSREGEYSGKLVNLLDGRA